MKWRHEFVAPIVPSGLSFFAAEDHGLSPMASAPVKAIELLGGSPNQGNRYHPVTKGNCVAARLRGEQLEVKEQSVMLCELDSAKPVGECPSRLNRLERHRK